MAKQFVESLSEPQNTLYYIGAHRSLRYPNDLSPPEPDTSISGTYYELYRDLIFGKHVRSEDVKHMIRRITWVQGTVYDMYDSTLLNPETKNLYVVTDEAGAYSVFKCLNNNGGSPSTSKPFASEVTPEDDFYRKDDGYEWKYMYTITASDHLKFGTTDYIPVFQNANVVSNAIAGSIDTMLLIDGGSNYASFAAGNIKESGIAGNNQILSLESDTITLSANAGFYENCSLYIEGGAADGEVRTIVDYFTSGNERRVLIDSPFNTLPDRGSVFKISPRVIISGDGQNAAARVDVNTATGSVSSIMVINRGSGYTYADVAIIGNTGIVSAETTTSAIARVIISPPGGHGSDAINELYANRVGISVAFSGTENATIPATNDFRKISLIKDPLFLEADLILNTTAEIYEPGEIITQASTNASAKVVNRSANTITITNISGYFATSNTANTVTGILGGSSNALSYINSIDRDFETFDQRKIYQVEILGGAINNAFILDETVVQSGLNTLQGSIIKLTLDGSAYVFKDGEIVVQTGTGAVGTVIGRFDSVLTLTNTSGYFATNTAISGAVSNTAVVVINFDNTFEATAVGSIHEITSGVGDTAVIALTNTVGEFLLSDDQTNTINTFSGQTSQAIASVTGLDNAKTKLVSGSGEFMYVENMIPIARSVNQTERIKLIVEF